MNLILKVGGFTQVCVCMLCIHVMAGEHCVLSLRCKVFEEVVVICSMCQPHPVCASSFTHCSKSCVGADTCMHMNMNLMPHEHRPPFSWVCVRHAALLATGSL